MYTSTVRVIRAVVKGIVTNRERIKRRNVLV